MFYFFFILCCFVLLLCWVVCVAGVWWHVCDRLHVPGPNWAELSWLQVGLEESMLLKENFKFITWSDPDSDSFSLIHLILIYSILSDQYIHLTLHLSPLKLGILNQFSWNPTKLTQHFNQIDLGNKRHSDFTQLSKVVEQDRGFWMSH